MCASPSPYDFQTALSKGVVDLSSDRWSGHDRALLIAHLPAIDPGLVNRFAFFYGGASDADLDETTKIAAAIHAVVPRALLGATLPEVVDNTYSVGLACGAGRGQFTGQQVGGEPLDDRLSWVDLSRPVASRFYDCLGRHFIDMGFDFVHFENAEGVIEHSARPAAAHAAYLRLAQDLRRYATSKGQPLYLSADHTLAAEAHLEAVYEPSRFYHLGPAMRAFRNRIERPSHGVGYSYALSPVLIAAQQAKVPRSTTVLFYVDNWNSDQDDLRRMMELDGENRRFLISTSLKTARDHGAVFVPSLDHCVGCIPRGDVNDICEVLPDGRTQYDALACGDMSMLEDDIRK